MTEKGTRNAQRHGAEAAIKRIHDGGPFAPIAADELARVENQLELKGVAAIQETNATRIQAACNLYWAAIEKAAQDHDLDRLDKFCARYGWLVGVATRAWLAVQQDRKGRGSKLAEVLACYRSDTDRTQEATGTAERSATAEAGINHGETITQDSPQDGQGGTE